MGEIRSEGCGEEGHEFENWRDPNVKRERMRERNYTAARKGWLGKLLDE